jgi:hypothetical protein
MIIIGFLFSSFHRNNKIGKMQITSIVFVVVLTIMFDAIKSELSSKEFEQIFHKIFKIKLIQSCWGVESSKNFFRQLSETVEECNQLSPVFNIDLFGNGKNSLEDSTEITTTTEVRNTEISVIKRPSIFVRYNREAFCSILTK